MPTQTFYNLPEEKRTKLVAAIRTELDHVPYSELSINQVIRLAGIPRGSFYQYFADKQDMLEYLLTEYRDRIIRQIDSSLQGSGGDIFQMFLDILDFTYGYITAEKHNAFFQNIFSDIRINMNLLQKRATDGIYWSITRMLKEKVEPDNLDIRHDDDLDNMLGVLLPLTGEAFARAFLDLSCYDEVRNVFAARLELIKRGFSKFKDDEQ